MSNNAKSSTSSGLGFTSMLQLIFIVLKLIGKITWSWWWVLAPTWISLAIALIVIVIVYVLMD